MLLLRSADGLKNDMGCSIFVSAECGDRLQCIKQFIVSQVVKPYKYYPQEHLILLAKHSHNMVY